ncbi:hypothetical protein AC249_AIPGENE19219 [Exaiptasia diaphana]|nr:hypothetical protein AC249_AIPGENE19219 [Exaiptasia diaphana]
MLKPGSLMVYGPSEKECGKGCTRNSTCFSFNFGTKPVFHIGDEPQYLCELLPTDKYNSSQLFAPSADFHHYSIQPILQCLYFEGQKIDMNAAY